jgi:hypothetical protein
MIDTRTDIAATGKKLAGFPGGPSSTADADITDPGKLGAVGQARDPNVRRPSDFVSFGEYASKNQNALAEMADRAARDVTDKRRTEKEALLKAKQATEMGFGNLEDSSGYADYLSAKAAADKAQEAAQINVTPNESSYESALRGIYGGQQKQRLDTQQQRLSGIEANVAKQTAASQKQRQDADTARRAADKARVTAEAQQEKEEREATAKKVADLSPEINRAASGIFSPTGPLHLADDGTIQDPHGAVYDLREDGTVYGPDGQNVPIDDRMADDIKAAARNYHRWF